MSFVTFVRDYIQDQDKIVHIPSFIFDACRELLWYIFSFQWLRNLTYVTLSLAYPEGLSSDSGIFHPMQNNGISQQNLGTSLSTMVGDFLASNGLPISMPNINETTFESFGTNVIAPFLLRTQDGFSFLYNLQNTTQGNEDGNAHLQLSLLTDSAYGFFNGITSNFHFCAVTLVIAHIILNENKNRAFKMALISCLGDFSCMVAVLLGLRRLIIPWFAAEPLGYFLGFAIQFYFALEIIKDNRRVKLSPSGKGNGVKGNGVGRLSHNYWLIPSLVLFSWCEQTQFFQTLALNSFQPTATIMGLPFSGNNVFSTWQDGSNLSTVSTSHSALPLLPTNSGGEGLFDSLSQNIFSLCSGRELQILVYLITYISTRIIFTWIGLSIFQKVIDWKSNNYFKPFNWVYNEFAFGNESKIRKVINLIFNFLSFIRIKRPPLPPAFAPLSRRGSWSKDSSSPIANNTSGAVEGQLFSRSSTLAPPKKIQHLLRDPLAIAAVTCSFAFLPSYSTNLLVAKSVGFFPEENRVKHSFFSPWDMPAEVLASDMDFISSHHNLAEYPFFLPFYDKGDYGGWLGVGEEDIRYGPFKLWQTRRIRAPWRRTTLQEPALTYANDKSLFVNPNPNPRKEESTSVTFGQLLGGSALQKNLLSQKEDIEKLPINNAQPYKKEFFASHSEGNSKQRFISPNASSSESALPFGEGNVQNDLLNSVKGINEPKDSRSVFLASESSPPATPFALYPFAFGDAPSVHGVKGHGQGDTYGIPKANTSVAENSFLTNTITKGGRKRLIEGFKKPTRKMSTSKLFNLSSFPSPSENEVKAPSPSITEGKIGTITENLADTSFEHGYGKRANSSYLPGFVNTLSKIGEKVANKFTNVNDESRIHTPSLAEVQIKNTKQIRKRFKKFKKRVRLFRTKSYKKRNTKIRRLKHFHYLRNKKKKRRKSRRLIYKLRRQFPYMRNIKERKAEIFGLYSPVFSSQNENQNAFDYFDTTKNYPVGFAYPEGVSMHDYAPSVHGVRNDVLNNTYNEKSFYDRSYPKNKGSRNTKKDFNLIFRTQIGERLDFAQEEIRARIFMNPYIRFLLNKRIDNFLSREKRALTVNNKVRFDEVNQVQLTKFTADAEEKLFKRRLIISKYADAIDFLKPNSRHSYVDRIYNHQFKGTLSTARRLFSLKVQFDQPLVHPTNYEPVLEHEDQIQNFTISTSSKTKGFTTTLLEKSSTAPFYAAWDSELRKLVFTNRYLDYKLATKGENKLEKNHHQQFTSWPLKESYFKDNEFLVSQLYSNSQPIDSFLSQENEKARSATLPRRVNSFNTVLSYKNSVPPTDAQRSQQFFKIENNDKKTFLFKHLWTSSNTAVSGGKVKPVDNLPQEKLVDTNQKSTQIKQSNFINKNIYKLPTSAEQRKTTRMEEREYPLWMVLRTLAPNQGGFLWPGD